MKDISLHDIGHTADVEGETDRFESKWKEGREMRRLIRDVGRTPVQRNTVYDVIARFDDPAQDPPSLEPSEAVELSGPTRWRLKQERFAKAAGY